MDIYGIGQIAMMAIFDYLEQNGMSTDRFVDELTPEEGRLMFADGIANMIGNRTFCRRTDGCISRKLEDPVATGNWIGKRLAVSNNTFAIKDVFDAIAAELNDGNDETVKDFVYGLIKGYDAKCLEIKHREEMQNKE